MSTRTSVACTFASFLACQSLLSELRGADAVNGQIGIGDESVNGPKTWVVRYFPSMTSDEESCEVCGVIALRETMTFVGSDDDGVALYYCTMCNGTGGLNHAAFRGPLDSPSHRAGPQSTRHGREANTQGSGLG
jgi:hypothetical protein